MSTTLPIAVNLGLILFYAGGRQVIASVGGTTVERQVESNSKPWAECETQKCEGRPEATTKPDAEQSPDWWRTWPWLPAGSNAARAPPQKKTPLEGAGFRSSFKTTYAGVLLP
jgi:hypothetical protein